MLLLSLNLFRLISSQHYSTPPYIVASEKAPTAYNATTTSKYYVWNDNSSIIDTPGIRSLDVSSFEPIELQDLSLITHLTLPTTPYV